MVGTSEDRRILQSILNNQSHREAAETKIRHEEIQGIDNKIWWWDVFTAIVLQNLCLSISWTKLSCMAIQMKVETFLFIVLTVHNE